ncbi:OmpR/PhoB-type domain-containing protein [Vibrio crassostreae]|nr:OmpR/PhoB-type domain-containing protein [Vibrio crassostreae]
MLINQSFEVDLEKAFVKDLRSNNVSSLGVNETELIKYFLCHPNELLSKKELIDHIWTKRGVVVEESSLMNTLSTCRKAFGDKTGEVIKTERGKGYRFVATVGNKSLDIRTTEEQGNDHAQSVDNAEAAIDLSSERKILTFGFNMHCIESRWVLVYTMLFFLSMLLGYALSGVNFIYHGPKQAKDYSFLTFSSCYYEDLVTSKVKILGPSNVVTVNGVSLAYNETYDSFSFPYKLVDQYCE